MQIIEISRKPENLSLAPVDHLVTLVFIDIEGYSELLRSILRLSALSS